MPGRKTTRPPSQGAQRAAHQLGILELERFSHESLTRWTALSEDLNELQAALYFGVLPEQRRLRQSLIEAVQLTAPMTLSLSRWSRIVTFQYSTEPLSAAGSLQGLGGRFNPGLDLDSGTVDPFPALYVAEDQETAFREKFQMASTDRVDGLTAQELALSHSVSHSTLFLNGTLRAVFDMTSTTSLNAVAKVLGRIRMPEEARRLKKKLRLAQRALWMIVTGRQLYQAVLEQNWRTLPLQFGLPAPGHTLGELIRAAGFEAILYRSTKGKARCLAVFPDRLNSGSLVELADEAPSSVEHVKLDINSGDELSGWDSLPVRRRPRKPTT